MDTSKALLDVAEKRSQQAINLGGNRTNTEGKESQKAPATTKLLSVDKALHAIKNGQTDKLKPFLLILARQIMPILVACNKTFHWQLDSQLADIQKKLND